MSDEEEGFEEEEAEELEVRGEGHWKGKKKKRATPAAHQNILGRGAHGRHATRR
jgi:hypothetical protein